MIHEINSLNECTHLFTIKSCDNFTKLHNNSLYKFAKCEWKLINVHRNLNN